MDRMMRWCLAAAFLIGLSMAAKAAPVATGWAPVQAVAREAGRDLVSEVGYHRRSRVTFHVGFGRPSYGYHRPVYYRPVRYRPVYYRPVRYRPVYYAPRRFHGPRCVVRYRAVPTAYGWVRRPVRVCRY
jgi:hypothetical protein